MKYVQAINGALKQALSEDESVLLCGLGVPDPKGIFGSTLGLQKEFGDARVFDIPLAENAMTGMVLGASITGCRPILTHQRLDFSLVSFEQIVNQIAKWSYMFGEAMRTPLVIRMIVGRGWGQGPQHGQSLQSLFGHIPGLRVIMPSSPGDAGGMLLSAIRSSQPIICIEHRWLYEIDDPDLDQIRAAPLDGAEVVMEGEAVTIVGMSYSVVESMLLARELRKFDISCEVIDLRSVSPIDFDKISESIKKTGNLVVIEQGHGAFSVSSEIFANILEVGSHWLQNPPLRYTFPDYPLPTSPTLAKQFYFDQHRFCSLVLKKFFGIENTGLEFSSSTELADTPYINFRGPF